MTDNIKCLGKHALSKATRSAWKCGFSHLLVTSLHVIGDTEAEVSQAEGRRRV